MLTVLGAIDGALASLTNLAWTECFKYTLRKDRASCTFEKTLLLFRPLPAQRNSGWQSPTAFLAQGNMEKILSQDFKSRSSDLTWVTAAASPSPHQQILVGNQRDFCRCDVFNDGHFSKLIIHPILCPRTFNVPCYVVSKKTARYDPCNKILHVKFKLRVKYFIFMLFSWHEALSTKDTSICVLVGNIGRWTDYLNITCLFSCGGRLKRGKFLKLKMRMGWSTLVSINVTANTVRAAKRQWWLKNYGQIKCMNLRTNPVFMCHFKHKKREVGILCRHVNALLSWVKVRLYTAGWIC